MRLYSVILSDEAAAFLDRLAEQYPDLPPGCIIAGSFEKDAEDCDREQGLLDWAVIAGFRSHVRNMTQLSPTRRG